ncbi:zinc-binding metallopeptidase family protein [Solicola sp. PLA-1-18]|uniref:zinc-binding metallopeptidase family protein n=1 Tax=Solicola sp. PLA-1-18 TaxID=3380532 RepID=UPI003B7F1BE7
MKSFACDVCGHTLYFENSVCVHCDSRVGYVRDARQMRARGESAPCHNLRVSGCNWIPEDGEKFCFACRLTRTRPSDADVEGLDQYWTAEKSKRRLVFELDELGLPIVPRVGDRGLAFDLLSSVKENVVTGHADGVITLDLAESDIVHREQLRLDLDEPYRTMLGHFRHEIGHYYEQVLVQGSSFEDRCRELFGDERADYQAALDRHYQHGAPDDWQKSYISKYATMHPWEDFAETFAHVLHIRDSLQTAAEFGLTVPAAIEAMRFSDVVVGIWIPLSIALNQINRSMGKEPLYPFVLAPPVVAKLQLVADVINDTRRRHVEDGSLART